jgi:hypothetical protein
MKNLFGTRLISSTWRTRQSTRIAIVLYGIA